MNPHEVAVEVLLEFRSLAPVPCKEYQVAFARRMFLDVADLAIAKSVNVSLYNYDSSNSEME